MARKGRKRKAGPRTKTGQLRRMKDTQAAKAREKVATVLDQPHRRWLPEERRMSQNAEDELGRLFECGALYARGSDPEQAQVLLHAGRRYQRLMHAFHQVMVAPMTNRSAGFASVAERVEADPDHDPLAHLAATESPEERHARVCGEVDRVTRLFSVLPPQEGRQQRLALDAVCLHGQRILAESLPHLQQALHRLAWLWGLLAEPITRGRTHAFRAERPAWDDSTDKVVVRR